MPYTFKFCLIIPIMFLTACDNGGAPAPVVPAAAENFSNTFSQVKTFSFTWDNNPSADHFKLMENPDGASGYTQVGSNISAGSTTTDLVVSLHKRMNAKYIISSCSTAGLCTDSTTINITGNLAESIGYFKASNTGSGDSFGRSISLSGDGNTLAVGADGEASNDASTPVDNSAANSGAVYVFTRNNTTNIWEQQAYLKASNIDIDDDFGQTISLSDNGDTLAVASLSEDSNNSAVQGDNTATNSGSVYIFTRNGTNWAQRAYLKASNIEADDAFGSSISLSGNGNSLAVGAIGEDSDNAGNENDNLAPISGAVYVFTRTNDTTWPQQAYIKASNIDTGDRFTNVSLNYDGDTLAVGAASEDSGDVTDQNSNSKLNSGAVYVFARTGVNWAQQAYLKASDIDANDSFGKRVSLSLDGNTLAVGTPRDDSSVSGDSNDNGSTDSGAVYVFTRSGTNWAQQVYLKASVIDAGDKFGTSISLSGDGNTLAVNSEREDSTAIGINGNQTNNTGNAVGATYIFTREGIVWTQQAYIKTSNPETWDLLHSLSLSNDGNVLAAGATGEDGNATGIGGDQTSNLSNSSGAVYLY